MKRACAALTRSGGQCRAPAREGGICYLHEDRSRAADLGRRGGSARRTWEAYRQDLPPLRTVGDVREFLSRIAADLCAGRLEPKRANALCYIATSLLKGFELSAREARTELDDSPPRSFESMVERLRREVGTSKQGQNRKAASIKPAATARLADCPSGQKVIGLEQRDARAKISIMPITPDPIHSAENQPEISRPKS